MKGLLAMRARAWVSAVAVTAACGGSAPPAQSPSEAATLPQGPEGTSAPAAGASQAAPSADANAGAKAFDAGNYAEARKSFEAATQKNPKDYDSFANLGLSCEKLGDAAGAEAAYKAALAVKPDMEAAAVALSAMEIDQGRADDALAVAKGALVQHAKSAPLHENVGLAMAARGDQEGATREMQAAIQLQPSDPMLKLTLAHWLNAWHTPGAGAQLDQARDLVKDDYGMLASIGHEYRMAGDFPSCEKTFDRLIRTKDGGEVRTERALCRLGQKDEKGMLEDLRAAVAAEPSYPTAHYYLGGRLALGKHFKDAAGEYKKYLDLAPNGSLAKPARERLKDAEAAGKK